MTHGEEPGSETHQDSAVLTYLEGLLMHQVAGGHGATGATRSEAGRDALEQGDKPPRGLLHLPPPPGCGPAAGPEQDRRPPPGSATQHLKKARLLRSEAWGLEPEVGGERLSVLDLNGRGGEQQQQHRGEASDSSPKSKGESTLLASLLQSFSSRLQTVALSQQIMQSLKQQGPARLDLGPARPTTEEPRPCFGAASSRLKGLMKKSKMQSHGGSAPYRRRAGPERAAEPPQASSDSLSCAARLKAVASLVNTRSSPAPASSPRPSVACSQLALLLSSEAHLQQYSREQALKARLSSRSASERLAAMATQQTQESLQAPDALLGSLDTENGALSPPPALGAGRPSPPQSGGGGASPWRTPQPVKERRAFDRHGTRPSQNCSSLLLHLLNNHNAQKRLNGHGQPRDNHAPRGSPLPSDSEYSNPDNSLPRDSSDTESSCSSSCSPIDLSIRSRVAGPPPGSFSCSSSSASSSSSSLDKLTESLISRWRPDNPQPTEDQQGSLLVKPHHKVTLLQLLLDHKNGEVSKVNRSTDNPDSRQLVAPKPSCVGVAPKPSSVGVAPKPSCVGAAPKPSCVGVAPKPSCVGAAPKPSCLGMAPKPSGVGMAPKPSGMGVAPKPSGVGAAAGRLTPLSWCEETRIRSPHSRPADQGFQAPRTFSQGRDSNGSMSPFSLSSPPPSQSLPLNLCKSKPPSNPDGGSPEPAFSASKLLQNLAQCGLQSSASSPPPLPTKLRLDPPIPRPPITLLERLNAPILRNGSPGLDPPHGPVPRNRTPVLDAPPALQIESLLERRTVLQLLLGAAGNKDTLATGGRRKRAAAGGMSDASEARFSCGSPDEVPLDAEVKTEPPNEGNEEKAELRLSWVGGESERLRPLSAPHRNVKREPVSPGTVARDGLLSQLLKQQCRNLPVNAAAGGGSAMKEEPKETLHHAPTVPKKRRFCGEGFPDDRPRSEPRPCLVPGNGCLDDTQKHGNGDDDRRSVSGSPRKPASLTEADSPDRGPAGEAPPTDARSFNVLKQLLLSDNCLKDLSQPQHRGTPSPARLHPECRLNGNGLGKPPYLQDLVSSPRDHSPPRPGVGHLVTGASLARPHPPSPPWGVPAPRQESPKLNLVPVKREAEGPVRWAIGMEERHEQHPDSPRLTKANPILYYMLQKGSAHLERDRRGRGVGLCGVGAQMRVKEEPTAAPAEDENHRLNSKHYLHLPDETPGGALERLNGSLKKC